MSGPILANASLRTWMTGNLERTLDLVRRLERHLAFRTRLALNLSTTAIWNGAGVAPTGLHALGTTSRIWIGDPALAPAQRGLVLLGAPFGTPEFVQAQLQQTLERQGTLLNQLPNLHDIQVAWLLLSCCTCPRAQYAFRTLPISSTHAYAVRHDAAVSRCLDSLLFADAAEGLPGQVAARVQLARCHGRPAQCGPSCANGLWGLLGRHPPNPAEAQGPSRPSTCPRLRHSMRVAGGAATSNCPRLAVRRWL